MKPYAGVMLQDAYAVLLTVWVLGDSAAYRRAYYVSLEDRLAVAERARELQERPSPAIEAMAYFCAAELLANATKHSGARRVTISVREQGPGLVMTVTDDGDGGARLVPGGGLAGPLERVQTVDGRLDVDSPCGGPTTIAIELPRHA